ncbi:Ribonuclease VapC11 [bacterium HR23]|uniref:PilT domain-containing protein n=1 Tax=uncultured prokaryote TaxID=198431 RepID=H5SLD6_9ZZZZ|nr:PilT domain-containing protein [uncultured prokaryote]GBD11002.1 Ribonuclease VapC11 [bacterium HR23]
MRDEGLYLVDTSAWLFVLRRPPVTALRDRVGELLSADRVAVVGMVVLELLGGARTEQERIRLGERLGGLHRLPTPEGLWEEAAGLAWRLRRRGVTAPFTDVLIAASAMAYGAILLHADRDFDLIARHEPLRVESHVETVRAFRSGGP